MLRAFGLSQSEWVNASRRTQAQPQLPIRTAGDEFAKHMRTRMKTYRASALHKGQSIQAAIGHSTWQKPSAREALRNQAENLLWKLLLDLTLACGFPSCFLEGRRAEQTPKSPTRSLGSNSSEPVSMAIAVFVMSPNLWRGRSLHRPDPQNTPRDQSVRPSTVCCPGQVTQTNRESAERREESPLCMELLGTQRGP